MTGNNAEQHELREPVVAPLIAPEASDRTFYMALRNAYLEAVDALERRLGITPRTAEIRQAARLTQRGGKAINKP